ncbi:MAG TPA: IS110 family transposase [Stellaceae bacterium]|jgi:transposase|nr:IS110 family transposase [Stellaceae bacterium]
MHVTTIGLDLAKHWFQVHGVDASGAVAVRRKLRRSEVLSFFQSLQPCLVGIEACATAHYWARELIGLGHEVKLMPPAYVKAYVKRNKNDAADAEAICEAVTRPSMRFVPMKDTDQQSVLLLHRARNLLVRQRTMLVNALRAHMAEFGMVAPQGLRNVELLTKIIAYEQERLPELARQILQLIVNQLQDTMARVRQIELRLTQWHRQSQVSRLLATVPGVGIMGASAIAATVADPSLFRSGREFAAWLGMTPRQNSSGGKERLGRTSKRGDKYIRSLLIAGAVAVLRHARNRPTRDGEWVRAMLARKPTKLAAVALANKTARIVWAVMMRGDDYRAKQVIRQSA